MKIKNVFILLLLTHSKNMQLAATVYSYIGRNSTPTASNSYVGPEAIFVNTDLSVDASGSSYFTGYAHLNGAMATASGVNITIDCIGKFMGPITEAGATAIAIKNDVLCGPRFSWSGNFLTLSLQDTNPATLQLSGNLGIKQGTDNNVLIINSGNTSSITLDGNGNTVTLGHTATNLHTPLVLRNMNIVINGTYPFQFTDVNGFLTLQDVNIFIDPVMAGSTVPLFLNNMPVVIKGMVTISGQGQVVDLSTNSTGSTSSSAIYIDDNATLKINHGVTLKVSPDITSINKKIYLKGACSTLHLNGCTLWVPVAGITTPGLQLERGMVIFENRVTINNEGNTNANKGLILGDGSSASNDVKLSIDGDAQVVVDGFLFHRPA